jgi:hypothetical protein
VDTCRSVMAASGCVAALVPSCIKKHPTVSISARQLNLFVLDNLLMHWPNYSRVFMLGAYSHACVTAEVSQLQLCRKSHRHGLRMDCTKCPVHLYTWHNRPGLTLQRGQGAVQQLCLSWRLDSPLQACMCAGSTSPAVGRATDTDALAEPHSATHYDCAMLVPPADAAPHRYRACNTSAGLVPSPYAASMSSASGSTLVPLSDTSTI